jgi:peptidoglycan glycosyltransferase
MIYVVLVAGALFAAFHFFGKNIEYAYLVRTGADHLKKGKIAAATSEFNKAYNLKPDSGMAIDGLGAVALRQNDFDKSSKLYTEAIAAGLKYDSTLNHSELGASYLDCGLYKNAEAEFRQALKLNSNDALALYGMGSCMHANMNLDDAISYYNKALQNNPKLSKARKDLSMAEDDKNKGAIYYMFDRNGEPLARYNLIPGQGKKSYILDQKAAHITGFDSDRRQRKEGMEKYLTDYLPGNRIYLTIDTRVQNAISRALGWYKGAVVVLNPKTGEILGMYSQPTFKPSTVSGDEWWKTVDNPNHPLLNRATDKLYEPGSIAKLITISAALEYGIDMKTVFPVTCKGSIFLDGQPFFCSQKHGRVTSLEQAVDESCNIGAAAIAFAIGGPRLLEYNTKFGFGQKFDIGFTDTVSGRTISIPVQTSMAPNSDNDKFELANHGCGLSTKSGDYSITVLHAALLAATVANGGIMMNPHIVKEIRNINGKIIYQAVPEVVKKPISPATAAKLTELMLEAVDKGLGQKARVRGVKIAGKTGTSGKNGILNAWFISFAPIENPEYAIAVFGDGEGKGMNVAAPVAGDIYKELLK